MSYQGTALPAAPAKHRPWVPFFLVGVLAAVLGMGAGSQMAGTTVTKIVPGPTVTRTVTKAPAACVNAIAGIAKVSLKQFKVTDLYHKAFANADPFALRQAEMMRNHVADYTANVKTAADTCVKAAGG